MTVVTVLLLIMNKTEFLSVHKQKENYHCDYMTFNLKRVRNLFPRAMDAPHACLGALLHIPSMEFPPKATRSN